MLNPMVNGSEQLLMYPFVMSLLSVLVPVKLVLMFRVLLMIVVDCGYVCLVVM